MARRSRVHERFTLRAVDRDLVDLSHEGQAGGVESAPEHRARERSPTERAIGGEVLDLGRQ